MGIGKQHGFIASSKLGNGGNGGGNWVTTFENVYSVTASTSWTNYSVKMMYISSKFSASGTKVRLTFRKPGSNITIYTGVFLGEGVSSPPYNYLTSGTQITANGGNSTFSITSDYFVSDEIDFIFDSSKRYIIGFCVSSGGPLVPFMSGDAPSAVYRYFSGSCAAGGNAGSWSSYSTVQYGVSKIEVFQPT